MKLDSGTRMNLFTQARKLDPELGGIFQNSMEITKEMLEQELMAASEAYVVVSNKYALYVKILKDLQAKIK